LIWSNDYAQSWQDTSVRGLSCSLSSKRWTRVATVWAELGSRPIDIHCVNLANASLATRRVGKQHAAREQVCEDESGCGVKVSTV
jgi:hypothetical protein